MQSDCQNYKMHVKLGTSIGWREIYKHISKGQHFLQSPHDLFLDTVFFALCIWLFYFYFSSSFFIFIFKNVKNTSALLFSHLYNENQQRSEKSWNDIEQGLHYQTTDNVPLLSLPFFFHGRLGVGSHPTGVQAAAPLSRWSAALPLRLALLIISGHCYRHLCSSHWPPAGDAGLFCCSTCGHPATRALGSTGTLRSLPAPTPTPASRVGRTSPRTTTTYRLSGQKRMGRVREKEGEGEEERTGREAKETRSWGRVDEQSCLNLPNTHR